MFKRVRRLIVLGALCAWSAVGAWLWFKPDTVPTFADDYLIDKWERELAEDDRKRPVAGLTCEVNSIFSGRSVYGKNVFGQRYNIGIADIAIPEYLMNPARRRLEELVRGKQVRVEVYTVVPDVGVIGTVFLDDMNVGAQLVSEGLAVAPSNVEVKSPSYRTAALVAAQKNAILAHRGFWEPPASR